MVSVNENENIILTLQLIKSNGLSVEEEATVSYQIFDVTATTEYVSGTATFNDNTKSYINVVVPSIDWITQEVGHYLIVWSISNTEDDFFEKYTEELQVDIDKTKIDKILGLVHQNILIDETKYDDWGNLESARVRLFYDSNKTNLLSTYQITSVSTDAGKFTTWEQIEV
jgi:hypothetical protein